MSLPNENDGCSEIYCVFISNNAREINMENDVELVLIESPFFMWIFLLLQSGDTANNGLDQSKRII
jgi:hypothetical protein